MSDLPTVWWCEVWGSVVIFRVEGVACTADGHGNCGERALVRVPVDDDTIERAADYMEGWSSVGPPMSMTRSYRMAVVEMVCRALGLEVTE